MGWPARVFSVPTGVFMAFVALGVVVGACGAETDSPRPEPATVRPVTPTPTPSPADPYVYYKNCDEAGAAGAAPLHRGDPGYRTELDRDGDGVACEPYFGR